MSDYSKEKIQRLNGQVFKWDIIFTAIVIVHLSFKRESTVMFLNNVVNDFSGSKLYKLR